MRPNSATAARPSQPSQPPHGSNGSKQGSPSAPFASRRAPSATTSAASQLDAKPRTPTAPGEQKILFQKFFKSVGPRTYAVQVKEASNGNHFLVVTEGKRDDTTGEVRKTRLFVFSEDFNEFFNLLDESAKFIKAHPVPEEVEQRRRRFWAKKNAAAGAPSSPCTASK